MASELIKRDAVLPLVAGLMMCENLKDVDYILRDFCELLGLPQPDGEVGGTWTTQDLDNYHTNWYGEKYLEHYPLEET